MKYILLLTCLWLWGCQQSQKTAWDRDATRLAVEKMLVDYHQAMKAGGIAAEFDYLDDSEAFFWVPPGYTTAMNYDEIRAILEDSKGSYSDITLDWESLTVHALSPDIASYSGVVHGIWTDTAEVALEMRLLESGTIIRRSDGWKLLSGQTRVLDQTTEAR